MIILVTKNLDVQKFFLQASVQTNLYKATLLWELFSPLLPSTWVCLVLPTFLPTFSVDFLCAAINGCLSNNRNSNKKKVATLLALFINKLEFIGKAFLMYFANWTSMPLNGTSMSVMCQNFYTLLKIGINDKLSTVAWIWNGQATRCYIQNKNSCCVVAFGM